MDLIKSYEGAKSTLENLRLDVNRFLNWLWLIKGLSLVDVRRSDIVEYLDFCLHPPESWVSAEPTDPFYYHPDGSLTPNLTWLPFSFYSGANVAVGSILTSLTNLFEYISLKEFIGYNPVPNLFQKPIQFRNGSKKVRQSTLSIAQINYCVETLKERCEQSKKIDNRSLIGAERALFIFTMAVSLPLRIAEFLASDFHTPLHSNFTQVRGRLILTTFDNRKYERKISVPYMAFSALLRWRSVLNLTPLPSVSDRMPLLPCIDADSWDVKLDCFKAVFPVEDPSIVWRLFKDVFDLARDRLNAEGREDEAVDLVYASALWLHKMCAIEDANGEDGLNNNCASLCA